MIDYAICKNQHFWKVKLWAMFGAWFPKKADRHCPKCDEEIERLAGKGPWEGQNEND